jgi:hypothetical protein
MLLSSRLVRACGRLEQSRPSFARIVSESQRSLNANQWIAVALVGGGELSVAVAADPDVKSAKEMVVANGSRFPEHRDAWEWVMLKDSHPEETERIKAAIAAAAHQAVDRRISRALAPANLNTAMSAYWYHRMMGEPAAASEIMSHCRELGVPLPSLLD